MTCSRTTCIITWRRGKAGSRRILSWAAQVCLAWVVCEHGVNQRAAGAQAGPPESPTIAPEEPAATEGGETSNEALDDLELFELDIPTVVTAARHEERLAHVPYAMSVLTADDIRRSGARTIPDALRLVPGVDVADLTYGNYAVSPRGFHGFIANNTLVLVDGRQIYDSLFGGTLWGSWPFQIEDIARIEVIRGPGGVIWGANAVNGVINIITKNPADQLGLTLKTSMGNRGYFEQYFGYGYEEEGLSLRISGSYDTSAGFRDGGSMLRKLDDEFKAGRIGVHAIIDPDEDSTFTLSAGSGVVHGGFPATPLIGIGADREPEAQANYILGKWTQRLVDDGEMVVTGFVNDFTASPGAQPIDYRYQQFGMMFSHTFESGAHTRTWGIDSRVDLLDAGNSDPFMLSKNQVSTGIIGLYLQNDWQFAEAWQWSMGGRLDYEFYGGFQPSFRTSLSYELSEDSVVYGSISRAFHMPAAPARFLQIPMLNGAVNVTTNRDVDPTSLMAYELGYRGRLFDWVNTTANLFWHQYDELTTFRMRPGPPGLIDDRLNNRSGGAGLYGVELEARVQVTRQFSLLGNYTYQQLNWDIDDAFTERDLITPPQHKFHVGSRYAVNDDFQLSADLFYVDAVRSPDPANPFAARRVDPYFRLDLRAEYEFWGDRASVALGVRNLLDEGHYEGSTLFLNSAEVPRMVYAELRVSVD